jgi:hypothetical protein
MFIPDPNFIIIFFKIPDPTFKRNEKRSFITDPWFEKKLSYIWIPEFGIQIRGEFFLPRPRSRRQKSTGSRICHWSHLSGRLLNLRRNLCYSNSIKIWQWKNIKSDSDFAWNKCDFKQHCLIPVYLAIFMEVIKAGMIKNETRLLLGSVGGEAAGWTRADGCSRCGHNIWPGLGLLPGHTRQVQGPCTGKDIHKSMEYRYSVLWIRIR